MFTKFFEKDWLNFEKFGQASLKFGLNFLLSFEFYQSFYKKIVNLRYAKLIFPFPLYFTEVLEVQYIIPMKLPKLRSPIR